MNSLRVKTADLISSSSQRRSVRIVLGTGILLLSLAVLVYLISKNWTTITAYRWQVNYVQLGLTLALHFLAFVIAVAGWHSIINRLAGADNIRLNTKIYCYSVVARRLPGIAWDIATRVVMYDQAGVSKALAGLASILELVFITLAGTAFYITLAPLTVSHASDMNTWPLFVALAVGAVLSHPRIVTYLVRRLRKDTLSVAFTYRDSVRWLSIYVLAWIAGGLMLFATVRSVYDLSSQYVLQVIADWTFVGVLTSFVNFVPSGLGLKEVTLTLLMSRYMPEHVAVAAAIFMRLLTTGYSILWLLISTQL